MIKLFTRAIAVLFLIWGNSVLFADFRTIGPGTDHTGNYEPWGSQEGYHRSAQLYLASEIGNMGSITSYAVNPHATKESIEIPIKIYMKMTTATSLIATDTFNTMKTGAILVYTGTISAVHGGEWNSVMLNLQFDYTGGNLLILTESNGTGSGHANAVYHYTNSTNRNWYYRVNNTPPTGNEMGTLNGNRAGIQIGFNDFPLVPNAAVVTYPLSSATLLEPSFDFTWTAPTSGTTPSGYKIFLGTDNPPTNLLSGTDLGNVVTYTPGFELVPGTTYYWEVIPYNENGNANGNVIHHFKTADALAAPYLVITPAATRVAKLDWNVVRGAASYRIYTSEDAFSDFDSWTLLAEVPTNTFTDTFEADHMRFYCITSVRGN